MLGLPIFKRGVASLALLANSARYDSDHFFDEIIPINLTFVSMLKSIGFVFHTFSTFL
jgi:hypothetical protein